MKTIEVIMLPVNDQQKAKAFYLSLGFELIMEIPSEHGETWLQLGLPGQSPTIALGKPQGVLLETENITKEIDGLKAKGIAVGKIDDTPWGKFAWLKDLDGNGLCLHQK